MKILTVNNIEIKLDLVQASAPIFWRMTDAHSRGGPIEWQSTPYQTADAGHRESDAITLVTEWLATQ